MSVASTEPKQRKRAKSNGLNLLTTKEKKLLQLEQESLKNKLKKEKNTNIRKRLQTELRSIDYELQRHRETYSSDCTTAK